MDLGSFSTDQSPSSTTSAPANFFADVGDFDFAEEFQTQLCGVAFNFKTIVPDWLLDEYDAGNTSFVNFFQHYYDWMYCSDLSDLYTDNINSLQDINNIIEKTKSAFNNSFVPQISIPDGQEEEFLRNFKRDIISKKGTPEGTALFFSKLFPEVVSVSVTTGTLSETIQIEVSEAPRPAEDYENAYNALMKPLGIETTILAPTIFAGSERTETEEDSDILARLAGTSFELQTETGISFENPLIGNYYVYNMGDTGTIGYTSGCSGSSHPRAIAGNTSNMPTFHHPNGVLRVPGASFGSINIYEFLYMPYSSSPNHGITGC